MDEKGGDLVELLRGRGGLSLLVGIAMIRRRGMILPQRSV